MINLLAAILASTVATPTESPVCLGVFVTRQDRVLRIMWVHVFGDKSAVEEFGKAALAEGYTPEDIKTDNVSSAQVTFISPRTTFEMADDLIQRARKGEFGTLTVEPMVMIAADGEMQKCLTSSGDRG